MTVTDRYAQWDAAYVLGSLSSVERREYEAHLAACTSCRSAVGDLSGMPALLALLDGDAVTDDADVEDVAPYLLGSLLARVQQRRRRKRWSIVVASAAAVLLAVGLLVVLWPAPPSVQSPLVEASELVAVTPSSYRATVTLTQHDWGTQIAMACTYAEPGGGEQPDDRDLLAMVAVDRDGNQTQLATWLATAGTTATPQASTSLGVDDITAVRVVSADSGEVLLEHHLDG